MRTMIEGQENMTIGKWTRMAVAMTVLAVMSGCVSPSLEDAAPDNTSGETTASDAQAAERATATEAEIRDNSFVAEGAEIDDVYPTFERLPTAANSQISDEERKALLAEMKALKASMKGRGTVSADSKVRYRELQELARKHVDETRKQIEE